MIQRSMSDPRLVKKLLYLLHSIVNTPVTFMEICGTHTEAFSRTGLRLMLPEHIRLLSGPGCPVCVTPASYVDTAAQLAGKDGVTLLTFGDMMNVPGEKTSLLSAKTMGARVRVVYSPTAVPALAVANKSEHFVFFACGFETTVPVLAAMVMELSLLGIQNVTLLCAMRRIKPALELILSNGAKLDGMLCPGHVAAVTGADAFAFIPNVYQVPAVVSGFEAADLLGALIRLVRAKQDGTACLINAYRNVVSGLGNRTALNLIEKVFARTDEKWRGFGTVNGGGYTLREQYRQYDACRYFGVSPAQAEKNHCYCGDVLRGEILPYQCPEYSLRCTPKAPLGPCMVTREGSCGVYYRNRAGA